MKELVEDHLRKERQYLVRALKDVEAQEAAGQIKGDRDAIKQLLVLRLAEIDRLLGDRAD